MGCAGTCADGTTSFQQVAVLQLQQYPAFGKHWPWTTSQDIPRLCKYVCLMTCIQSLGNLAHFQSFDVIKYEKQSEWLSELFLATFLGQF